MIPSRMRIAPLWGSLALAVSVGLPVSIAPTSIITRSVMAAEQVDRSTVVVDFLNTYCLQCHDSGSAEGEREFESFALPIASQSHWIVADEIIDQITLKEMPPLDADQPSDDERIAVIEALRAALQDAREQVQSSGARTVLRRLSHREYENTLAVLFDRRVDTLGLTADFPKENTVHHMDNVGEALVTSGFLLDQYFHAADRLVETRLARPSIPPQSWHFTDNFVQYEELTGAHKSFFKFEYLCLYEQPNTDTRQGGYGHVEDFLEGVPVSGLYDIEVHAQAMHRDTHYDPKIFRIDFSEPFQIAVVPGDVTKGHIHYPQSIEPILGQSTVPDDQPEWLKFRVWLEAGQTPRFIFPNGPYESRASVIEVNKRYNQEFKDPKSANGVSRTHILREGKLPHIKIGEIKIHGPIAEPDGSTEELAVFGPKGFQPAQASEQLLAFGERAFRRPLEQLDRDRIETIYQKRIAQDATPRQAALDTVKMMLCSPSFLYLSEVTPEEEDRLRPHDLAARLSYTLWTAPPDETLFASASSGALNDPAELRRQIERMLADERSQHFVQGFVDSWLNLRDIGNLPPPRPDNIAYYAENLPEAMKREAYELFSHLLDQDGPVTDLIDCDYTFVDKKLAKLYQLPERETMRLADGFQRVSLTGNRQRGGVLGMAGVLTVSANGVDTSPVTRGVWVSENLLGIEPPTPPDVVPEIEADVSGSKTIREKLAKHSQDATCAVCHRKIDPFGYALERFDPIGRWRNQYAKPNGKSKSPAPKVDPSGQLPSGETYQDFAEFKTLLATARRDHFVENLIDKLMIYSTGRPTERSDRFAIEEISEHVQANGFGLKTMVLEVLLSEHFRRR
ncbi:DUF1592 domain-containing protein [Neorhodopirellula pilleata]|uniref:Planctomycete cytochrome C n=1 Tax=Neorhodopirellula pilleata TaxID=2714738 RepID=A0A5C5ZI96_9BACT|nr:DUF1592 domain-containing protein [Neorhodopirellula pilleata]TWT86956.1 hypothetical protein Pla100_60170 [Neorhodopirellula pilleata]